MVLLGGPSLVLGAPAPPRAPPPPPLETETAALARAPERARRPVEVVPEANLLLPSCEDGAAHCDALGPSYGLGVSALYRPSPYFGFGGTATYARTGSALAGVGSLRAEAVGLGVVMRVYLLERGALDPYLELALGYGSFQTAFVEPDGARARDSAFGPSARAGGGLDYVTSESWRIGFAAGFSSLVLGRREQCRAGFCELGTATSAAMTGALVASLRVTLLLGDPL